MIKIYLQKYNFSGEPSSQFLSEMANLTQNYTCADIKGLCQNAQLQKFAQGLKSTPEAETDLSVTEDDLRAEYHKFVKGMTREEMLRYEQIYAKWQDKSSVKDIVGQQKQMLS